MGTSQSGRVETLLKNSDIRRINAHRSSMKNGIFWDVTPCG
jgi:hypothetical protein